MSWNYRVIKRVIGGEESFQVHEVYYNDDGTIKAWTENSIIPTGETTEELKKDFLMQLRAFDEPIIDYDQLTRRASEKR